MNEPVTINGLQVALTDATRFAPVVHFHPFERYFPCSIEYLLGGSTLVLGDEREVTATAAALFDARHDAGAHLRIDQKIWGGMMPEHGVSPAPMYYSVQVPPDRSFVDFTYYFLSAFNGPQTCWVRVAGSVPLDSFDCAIDEYAEHQGDVENITVRVTPDLARIVCVGFSAHGDFSYYLPQDLEFEAATHPVVSCAAFSHASYNRLDTSKFIHPDNPHDEEVLLDRQDLPPKLPLAALNFMDDVSWGEIAWRPFAGGNGADALVRVGFQGDIDHPVNGQQWASFQGDLGEERSNSFTRVEQIRQPLSQGQIIAFDTGGVFAGMLPGVVPGKYKTGSGPDGFGKRGERLLQDRPSHVAMIVSRLNPLFVLAGDTPTNGGSVVVTPLAFGEPPSTAQQWTVVSREPKGLHGSLYNNLTGLVAAVPNGSAARTPLTQTSIAKVDDGARWTSSGGEHGLVALRPLYDSDLNVRITQAQPLGAPVALDKWGGGQPYERWGFVNVMPGVSRLSLAAMYRSSSDDTLWWTVFDPATGSWYPDAPIGQGMSAHGGPALAVVGGTLMSVYQGTDSQLWWTSFDAEARAWRRNQPFGQGMSTGAGPALAVLNGTLYCVHKGNRDNDLWWTTFDPAASRWDKDRPFGQGMSTAAAPALAVLNGTLYCVHKGNGDNQLWWSAFDPRANVWQKNRAFGHGIEARGLALAVLNGVLYCVHRGTDDQLWWTTFDASRKTWQPNRAFGQGMNSLAAPALAVTDGTLYCVHRGGTHDGDVDDQLWWTAFDAATATWPKDRSFAFDIRSQDAPAIVAVA